MEEFGGPNAGPSNPSLKADGSERAQSPEESDMAPTVRRGDPCVPRKEASTSSNSTTDIRPGFDSVSTD